MKRFIGSGLKKRLAKELHYKNIPTIPVKYQKRKATQRLANALKRMKASERAEENKLRNLRGDGENLTAKQRRVKRAEFKKMNKVVKLPDTEWFDGREDPVVPYTKDWLRMEEIRKHLDRKRKATGRTDVRKLGKRDNMS